MAAVNQVSTGPVPRPRPEPTIAAYGRFVLRHRRLVVGLAVLGLLVGIAIVMQQPVLYTARSRVAVSPQDVTVQSDAQSDQSGTAELEVSASRRQLLSLDSDAQVLSSTRVLRAAIDASGLPIEVADLRERLDVSAIPSSRVLVVAVSHPDRVVAVELTDAVVAAFLLDRSTSAERRVEAARAGLEEQIAAVSEQLASLRVGGSSEMLDPRRRAAEQEFSERVTALQNELVRAAATAGDAGEVVVPARIVGAPGRPMAVATVASAVLLGAAVGMVSAAVGARRIRRGPG